jgi:hypothetical protein
MRVPSEGWSWCGGTGGPDPLDWRQFGSSRPTESGKGPKAVSEPVSDAEAIGYSLETAKWVNQKSANHGSPADNWLCTHENHAAYTDFCRWPGSGSRSNRESSRRDLVGVGAGPEQNDLAAEIAGLAPKFATREARLAVHRTAPLKPFCSWAADTQVWLLRTPIAKKQPQPVASGKHPIFPLHPIHRKTMVRNLRRKSPGSKTLAKTPQVEATGAMLAILPAFTSSKSFGHR